MESKTRLKQICLIQTVEILEPTKEGVELNEGYRYEVDGSIPQLADGIAKLAIEMDGEPEVFGDKGGALFLSLILEYYGKIVNIEGGEEK